MKQRGIFDLAVVGGDAAAYAAAACAAKSGALTALIRLPAPQELFSPAIPDFVWRRLSLHDAGINAKPISARISLFEDGASVATYASLGRSQEALEQDGLADAALLEDFDMAMRRLQQSLRGFLHERGSAGASAPLLEMMTTKGGESSIDGAAASAAEVLNDFFSDERLKTHFAGAALSAFGLGGDEPASVLALAPLGEPAAWRTRAEGGGAAILKALERAAQLAEVEILDLKIARVSAPDSNILVVQFDDGEEIRTRALMASSAAAAAAAGLAATPSFLPLMRRNCARAFVTVRFASALKPPRAEPGALYQLADSLDAFAQARDAAAEGRFMERMPVSFEFDGDAVKIEAPWCPAIIRTEGEPREWTEQDRQAFGGLALARIAPYLNGAAPGALKIDVAVALRGAPAAEQSAPGALIPAASHDVIGAAARLALDLVTDD